MHKIEIEKIKEISVKAWLISKCSEAKRWPLTTKQIIVVTPVTIDIDFDNFFRSRIVAVNSFVSKGKFRYDLTTILKFEPTNKNPITKNINKKDNIMLP